MKKEDIKHSFNQIGLDEDTKQKMLSNIKNDRNRFKKTKRTFPVLVIILMLLVVSVAGYKVLMDNNILNYTADKDQSNNVVYEDSEVSMDDAVEEIRDQFILGDKEYHVLENEKVIEFGFTTLISEEDIGERLTTITTSVDENLIGKDVYRYLPAGGDAVVAIEETDGYRLFMFSNFETYLQNQDEAAQVYLNLYGINEVTDIEKVHFSGNREMTDKKSIAVFYDYYSVLENASDQYFASLFNWEDDNNEMPTIDKAGQSTPAYEGTTGNALANSVNIRIYNQSGVYYETVYYPNIGFISRHQVDDEFARFLEEYIN